MTRLVMLVQQSLAEDPFGGAVFAFRGRRPGLIKLIWHDGVGLCMLTKQLEQGEFVWPSATTTGKIALSSEQLERLTGHQFGRRSEQLSGEQLQFGLEDLEQRIAENQAEQDAAPPAHTSTPQRKRAARNHGSLPVHLARYARGASMGDCNDVDPDGQVE